MSSGITFTAAQIKQITDMIADGVLSSGHGDKRVQFESFDGLEKRLKFMLRCNAKANGQRITAGLSGFRRNDR